MSYVEHSRVGEALTVTGTGDITTGSTPLTNLRTFANACTVGDTFPLWIIDTTAGTFEESVGTYSAANTITRTPYIGQTLVSFAGNSCQVFINRSRYNDTSVPNVDPSGFSWVGFKNWSQPVYASHPNNGCDWSPTALPAYFPVLWECPGIISAVTFEVYTASATAGSGALVALMAPTAGSASSWTILCDFTATTNVDLTTKSTQTISNFTPFYLPRGLYILQVVENATGSNSGSMRSWGECNGDYLYIFNSTYETADRPSKAGAPQAGTLNNPLLTASDLKNSINCSCPVTLLGVS